MSTPYPPAEESRDRLHRANGGRGRHGAAAVFRLPRPVTHGTMPPSRTSRCFLAVLGQLPGQPTASTKRFFGLFP
jgi:hypothetical protein